MGAVDARDRNSRGTWIHHGARRHERIERNWRAQASFLFVFVVLASGFCLALGLPITEAKGATLLLGLPFRAAIVIYGIGLLPIVVLPVAYAITFDTQTLSESDIARVKELAAARRAANPDAER